ncbi:MAG: multiprotein bridging factor aMBF1 [Candidatus Heimdallarchaeota archaeon]
MSCEMCGTFVGPDLVELKVDNVRMLLCRECSKFGTKASSNSHGLIDDSEESAVTFVKSNPGGKGPSVSHVKTKTGIQQQSTTRRKRYRDSLDSDEVLVEDYGTVIKNARKAKGLSLEDFAQMINEKLSLMQKIEKSEFNPPQKILVKIERKLHITLREEASAPIYTGTSVKSTTLGDVVKLKKKKR